MTANYHVMKDGDDWVAKKEGAERASARADTQAAAERLAKQYSGNQGGGEVHTHRADTNAIRNSDTVKPARDPKKSKG